MSATKLVLERHTAEDELPDVNQDGYSRSVLIEDVWGDYHIGQYCDKLDDGGNSIDPQWETATDHETIEGVVFWYDLP